MDPKNQTLIGLTRGREDVEGTEDREKLAENPKKKTTIRVKISSKRSSSCGCPDKQELYEIIRQSGEKWCLYSKKKSTKTGKRKNLGCYPSREDAEKREKQIQYFKHKGE